jgi:tetratricopeptide (TPR) repeat protein
LAAQLPNASSPLPATSTEVIEEVNHLVDWLVARFPDDPDSYEVTARVRFWLGDSEAAAKCWEKCVELSPAYAYAYHGMGLVAAKKGEHEKAADLFRKVLELAPGAAAPEIDLATALVTLGRMEEAAAVLEKHVRRARDPAPGLILLGKAYLNLNKCPQAKATYEAAAKLQPDSADVRFGLATACFRLGESQEAKKQMAKFKDLMAKEKEIRKAERSRADDVDEMRAGLAAIYHTASRVCGLGGAPRQAEQFARRAAMLSQVSLPVLPAPEDPRSRRMNRGGPVQE